MRRHDHSKKHFFSVFIENPWALAGLLLAIFVTMLLLVAHLQIMWGYWQPASCMPNNCFNETLHSATVRQPINAWSSLIFVVIGLLIIVQSLMDVQRLPEAKFQPNLAPGLARLYGAAVVIIGLGSWFYHASLTFVGQALDVQGMYLLITFAVIHSISRLRNVTTSAFVLVYILANATLLVTQLLEPEVRRYIFATLVLATLFCEYQIWHIHGLITNPRYLIAALLFISIGFGIWILDMTHKWNDPDGFFQGHAIWHILSSFAAGCLYLHYRTFSPRASASVP